MNSVQQQIEQKVKAQLAPNYLDVINESHMHGTPTDHSHFKLIVVSDAFEGKRLLQRHRQLNQLLADELAGPVHALSLHLYSPAEWQEQQQVPESPTCRGGSKLES